MLSRITTRFYAENAESFSATRSRPWDGWAELANFLRTRGWGENCACPPAANFRLRSVLDIACGNMRFERFLSDAFSDERLAFTCVDNCGGLSAHAHRQDRERLELHVRFIEADIIESLISDMTALSGSALALHDFESSSVSGDTLHSRENTAEAVSRSHAQTEPQSLAETPLSEKFDLVVSFGFMHHIPGSGLRAKALDKMLQLAKPGAIVAISLWRFADDPRFLEKARKEHAASLASLAAKPNRAPLLDLDFERGDYMLGWNHESGAFRYCHSFNDAEIDELVSAAFHSARLVHRFRSDGRTGNSNDYLLFERLQ